MTSDLLAMPQNRSSKDILELATSFFALNGCSDLVFDGDADCVPVVGFSGRWGGVGDVNV